MFIKVSAGSARDRHRLLRCAVFVSYALSGGLAAGRATRIYTGSEANRQNVTCVLWRCNMRSTQPRRQSFHLEALHGIAQYAVGGFRSEE